ncbi:MAG: T9SS type A sorting domain-containing protein [Bacteroidota bacterium]|nr:T9SS type A sorting domain-containing protein [Bacteroidota bacterium]
MKKIITFSFLLILLINSYSASQDKKVLFEEFTNASCFPCAQNNPALKSYIDSKGDTIVAVKYHTDFPGFDPMYNHNPLQVNQRRTGYYSDVNAMPWLKGDGDMFPDIWLFTLANLDAAFNTRKAVTPLLKMQISDERITGDSIKSTVYVQIAQNLPAGDYRLRVMAVEKIVTYPSPPGSNGESVFEHVFRRGYPDMLGVQWPTAAGSYVVEFRYKIDPEWIDSSIHTIAFIQNDASNKEVINCAMGQSIVTGISNTSNQVPKKYTLRQNYPNPFNPSTSIKFDIPKSSRVKLAIYNSMGQEVSVLLNEELIAGSYEYGFNASNFSSGMYYYKLEASDFSDTKKMMVIK